MIGATRSELTTSCSCFSGTAYAFRREAVIKAGLFPELLYMHYEEAELAWRILDGGGEILHMPDLAAVHHADPVSRRNEVEMFLKPRNQILLAASCLPFVKAMGSALKLLPRQLEKRKPLRRETLARIRKLKSAAADDPPVPGRILDGSSETSDQSLNANSVTHSKSNL